MASYDRPWQGFLGDPPTKPVHQYMEIDNVVYEIHKPIVFRFIVTEMGTDKDVSETLSKWLESEEGLWVTSKSIQSLEWHRVTSPLTLDDNYAVRAFLKGPDYTFWSMKWGS